MTVLPVFITAYLIFWSLSLIEHAISTILKALLPEHVYFPGMGILVLLVSIFLIGLALKEAHLNSVFNFTERSFAQLPLVRTIYGTCKDFVGFFSSQNERKRFNQVVTVRIPDWDMKVLGFITEEDLNRHHTDLAEDGWIAVYLPMGYQIGGYTLLIDKAHIEPVNMPLEDAMRFVLTAGVASNPNRDQEEFEPESAPGLAREKHQS